MSLSQPSNLGTFVTSSTSDSPFPGLDVGKKPKPGALGFESTKERIKKMFDKIELSISSYDTASVAMVPSLNSQNVPFFPECVNWILDNQLLDGSWGLADRHPFLMKDALLSALACVLALKQWDVGQEHRNKGLSFIESNLASVTDEKQHCPIGFDIIFPSMIERAKSMGLNVPLGQTSFEALIHKRELELSRGIGNNSEGRRAYLSYVSEGIGKLQDWEMVMKYQRKNGSLFNSPSTTAAALTHLNNDGCLDYLRSLLEKFGNAVPTVYPVHIYVRLYMVDCLQKLGIDQHFREEIRSVLDETYRCWLQGEEDIFLEPATCAIAFRILRVNGFDVSSDPLAHFSSEYHFSNCLGGYLKDIAAALELFKASQITIGPDESILEKLNSWTSNFLKSGLSSNSFHSDRLNRHIKQEVGDALEFTLNATLERLSHRRAMENYSIKNIRILKTSYRCINLGHEDFLKLAVEDYNISQHVHRKELEDLARWVVENRLDKLKFARQKLSYCYFSAAATLPSTELSNARLSWTKNGVLTTVVDDFFDVGGSEEELLNLIQLVERWNVDANLDYCSEEVEIIFLALYNTICEIGSKASPCQGDNVTSHIIEIWLELLKSMLKEAEWLRHKSVPPLDEYMTNGYISFALGPIVLPALYFVGPKLSKEVIGNAEYHNLYKLMSTCGRLLNDIRGFERESKEGKLNAVSLRMTNGTNTLTKEEAIEEMEGLVNRSRTELRRLVLREKGSTIPRACKDLFWKMSTVLHLFYMKDDGFTSQSMMNAANALIKEPILLDQLLSKKEDTARGGCL